MSLSFTQVWGQGTMVLCWKMVERSLLDASMWRYSDHVQLEGDPEADPKNPIAITYPTWPRNTSSSKRNSWRMKLWRRTSGEPCLAFCHCNTELMFLGICLAFLIRPRPHILYLACKYNPENQSSLHDNSPSPMMLHDNPGWSTNGYIGLMEAGILVTTNSPI